MVDFDAPREVGGLSLWQIIDVFMGAAERNDEDLLIAVRARFNLDWDIHNGRL